MLLAVLDARRTTKDADLAAHGIPNDPASVAGVVAAIAAIALSSADGIVFDAASIATEQMREAASYRGVRAKLPAMIGSARVVIALDFSFGDPGEAREILYPELLGGAGIALRAYPIERVLAEKIATMMERRELNTRDRDFADVWVLSRIHALDARDLRVAIIEVADHREHLLIPLAEALADMPDRQQSYDALRRRASFAIDLPDRWSDLIAGVAAFVDPLIADDAGALFAWDLAGHRWI